MIVLLKILVSSVDRWDLGRQPADDFGHRPTDAMRLKVEHSVVRIALLLTVVAPPTWPAISHVANRRDNVCPHQATVSHEHTTGRATGPGDLFIRRMCPEVEK